MPSSPQVGLPLRAALAICRGLAGWPFAAFVLLVLGFGTVAMLAVTLVPPSATGLGAFAEDFKIWCFGYDPVRQTYQPVAIVLTVLQPLVLGTVVAAFWWQPLREVLRTPRRLVPVTASALAVVTSTGAGMTRLEVADKTGVLAFPADGLRTQLPTPKFRLIDQDGKTLGPQDFAGKVLLLTAVYGSCGLTCPTLFARSKAAVAGLTEAQRRDVVVLAVTLDPLRDTPQTIGRIAQAQKITAPTWHVLSGEPAQVEQALDDMAVARRRDPKTGVIDHANLFLLIDRQGRLAYRLSLGERQNLWLGAALRHLLAEPFPTPPR